MAGEWKSFRLGLVCKKIGSGATPHGGSSVYLDKGEVALIRSQNVYNDGLRREGLVYLTDEHAAELVNVEVELDDILLNITGDSVARACQVAPDVLPARVNQHVAIIRTDSKLLWPRFLRYVLVSPSMQAEMLGLAGVGATRNALTKGMIKSFKIDAPSDIDEQRAIGHVLGTLDDKIEVNRGMNGTLEAIARAIFKSWFVDFDPVRAKARGEAPESICHRLGLTPDLLALFPDRFFDSELGETPEGWDVKPLDEIANYLNGLALQKFPPESDSEWLPVIKIAQLKSGSTVGADRASHRLNPEYVVDDGDVLFSWSGSLEVDVWCGGRGALNQHLFKVTSKSYPKWFFFHWTREHLAHFRTIAAGKAVTMGHIQRKHLTEALCAVPPGALLDEADGLIAPMFQHQIENRRQSRTLAAIRDALLPKLLSGELRVPLEGAA